MAKKKDPVLKLVTPKGQFMYAHLFKPDTKFNDKGTFRVDVLMKLNDPGVKEFLKQVKDFQKETEAGPKLPYKVDEEAGTAVLKTKTMEPPTVVDAKKVEYTEDPRIGNGTTGKVSVSFAPYEQQGGGIACYIRAVQVINLKVYCPGVDDFEVEEADDDDEDEAKSETAKESTSSAPEDNDDDIPF